MRQGDWHFSLNSLIVTTKQVIRKQRIKNMVYTLLGGTSLLSGMTSAAQVLGSAPALRILIYYKINEIPGNTLSVTPHLFARQLRFLTEHYTVISPEDLIGVVAHGGRLPGKAVLITFDDGYRDVYENAYPVLQSMGLKAILFPATDYIGTTTSFPHDERLPMPNPALDWDHIRAMQDVFTIGSHTRSHRVLTTLPLEMARNEIVSSRALIEDRLGSAVRFFSYPKGASGDFSQRLEDMVEEAGYLASFVTLTGSNTVARLRSGKWLRRHMVEPFGRFTFARLLDGSCDAIGLKDTRWGVTAKRTFNRMLGTVTR
ncbi:MAG: hypothetical protein OJF52_001955 [Nitrospira sp.]|nr:MAG: hypothetical protein OJF52_001955 [Nitrospira sp.]